MVLNEPLKPVREPDMNLDDLVMLPWTRARAALADRPLRVRVLTPPYGVVGLGTLRLLRVIALDGPHDGALELTCGYEGYDRISWPLS